MSDFIAVDVETGGLDAAECAVLSIAAVASWEGVPPFQVFVLPGEGLRVDPEAARVNGYSEDAWKKRGAVSEEEAVKWWRAWLLRVRAMRPGVVFAAHNAGFDALFMLALAGRTKGGLGLERAWVCTRGMLEAARGRGWLPAGRNRLDDLGEVCGFWRGEARVKEHDALQDARCCRAGLLFLRELAAKKEGGAS
jgi:DNA polymerase III epsilon subunit-like protein